MNEMVLAYIIVATALIGFSLFIYEGVIAPELRMIAKNDLFASRDKLRKLLESERLKRETYDLIGILDGSICFSINQLREMHFRDIEKFIKSKKSIEINKKIQKRFHLLETNTNEQIFEVFNEVNRTVGKVIFINSLPYALSKTPFFLARAIYWKFKSNMIQDKLSSMTRNVTLTRESEKRSFFHSTQYSHA